MVASGHFRRDALQECCAIGYRRDGSPNTDSLAVRGSPAGGGYATAPDLWRFAQAFLRGGLVSRETRDVMISPHAQTGPTSGYGFGFGISENDGILSYGHSGGAPGISVDLTAFPVTGYTLVVLSNADAGARGLSAMLRRIVLGTTAD
jgi:CubicO group peptidase (beta-lactamase class C family)